MKGKFKKQKIWLSYILPPLVLEMTHVGMIPTLTSEDASICVEQSQVPVPLGPIFCSLRMNIQEATSQASVLRRQALQRQVLRQ